MDDSLVLLPFAGVHISEMVGGMAQLAALARRGADALDVCAPVQGAHLRASNARTHANTRSRTHACTRGQEYLGNFIKQPRDEDRLAADSYCRACEKTCGGAAPKWAFMTCPDGCSRCEGCSRCARCRRCAGCPRCFSGADRFGADFFPVGPAACARRGCSGCCYCAGQSLPVYVEVRCYHVQDSR